MTFVPPPPSVTIQTRHFSEPTRQFHLPTDNESLGVVYFSTLFLSPIAATTGEIDDGDGQRCRGQRASSPADDHTAPAHNERM